MKASEGQRYCCTVEGCRHGNPPGRVRGHYIGVCQCSCIEEYDNDYIGEECSCGTYLCEYCNRNYTWNITPEQKPDKPVEDPMIQKECAYCTTDPNRMLFTQEEMLAAAVKLLGYRTIAGFVGRIRNETARRHTRPIKWDVRFG